MEEDALHANYESNNGHDSGPFDYNAIPTCTFMYTPLSNRPSGHASDCPSNGSVTFVIIR
jgi:hypothetical protein